MPPPPNPNAPPEAITFGKFTGLRNTVTAERLSPSELASAVNIDLDDAGQARRRRGYTLKLSGDIHSLFGANDGSIYGVRNNNLVIINPDYSTEVLKVGLNSDPSAGLDPLCWAQVGDTIYYSSRSDSGQIKNGAVLPWGAQDAAGEWFSPVLNPTANLPAIRGKLLAAPPMASCMTYFNGRLYLAQGRTLWATELFSYNFVDKTRGFRMFEGEITLLGTVGDGIYVGTDEGLWFMTGSWGEMKRSRIMDSAVIPGSMVDIPAELANPPQVPADADTPMKISISFLTTTGFCVAQDGGQAYNLTEDKVVFPDAVRSAALYRRQDGINQYIAVTDSGGTPTASTRIGDYVDAELIRGGRWSPARDGVVIGDRLTPTWS